MYSRNSFGSYYPVNSTIHKLNPVVKLLNFIIAIILMLLTNNIEIHLLLLSILIFMIILSHVPFNYYFKTFYSLRYIYLFLIFFLYFLGFNFDDTVCYLIKLIILVLYINMLAFTTSPSQSIYGIEKFLSYFNFLMLPITKISIKINSILRYFPLLLEVTYKSLKSQSSRGIDYYNSNIFIRMYAVINLFGNCISLTKKKSKERMYASELKLYNTKRYRTIYKVNRISFNDLFFILFHFALIYVYLLQRGII